MKIKRYDLEWVGSPYLQRQEMVECVDGEWEWGDWVMWEDVAPLIEQLKEKDKEIKRLNMLLETAWHKFDTANNECLKANLELKEFLFYTLTTSLLWLSFIFLLS